MTAPDPEPSDTFQSPEKEVEVEVEVESENEATTALAKAKPPALALWLVGGINSIALINPETTRRVIKGAFLVPVFLLLFGLAFGLLVWVCSLSGPAFASLGDGLAHLGDGIKKAATALLWLVGAVLAGVVLVAIIVALNREQPWRDKHHHDE